MTYVEQVLLISYLCFTQLSDSIQTSIERFHAIILYGHLAGKRLAQRAPHNRKCISSSDVGDVDDRLIYLDMASGLAYNYLTAFPPWDT